MIRRAMPEEASVLRDLAEATFRESFAHAIPGPILDDLMAKRFTVPRIRQEVEDPFTGYFVAETEGASAGYAVTRPLEAPATLDAPVWELHRIYVRKTHHGTGLGEGLMSACVTHAVAHGAASMWLRVLSTNDRAIAFYRRWGFHDLDREALDLQGTILPHLILAKRLGAQA